MSRLRVALGVRNSHNPVRNLVYAAWKGYTWLKSDVVPAPEHARFVAQLKCTGIAKLGVSDVDNLARIVDEKLVDVPLVNGLAQLSRKHNPVLVPYLFKILQEYQGAIEAYYGAHFRVNWFEVQRIVPGRQPDGSSFAYHTDDTPRPVVKLFVYLNDTYESNGAFRAFEYEHTDELLKRGMLASVSPGERRMRAQKLVPAEFEQKLTVVEGVKGTAFVFDNNLIHKGTLPTRGMRTHVSMELMPATAPVTEASLFYKCDEPIAEYFPVNPFRQSDREKSVALPLRRRIRKYANKLGLDITRYDSSRGTNDSDFAGIKPAVPERIVIGGGGYGYGHRWHNIEYVTAGYANKYKALPKNIDIAHDLTSGKPFPIREGTIAAAFTSHVIEHLKDEHVSFIFRDTWRVLKPGGYFRISCPNVDLYVRAFLDKDLSFFHYRHHPFYVERGIENSVVGLFLDVFASQQSDRSTKYTYEEIRAAMESLGVEQTIEHYCRRVPYDYAKSHYHVNWFNPAKLTRMLTDAGFREVYVSALGQSFCPDMRDLSICDTGDPKISLFMECRK